LLNSFLVLLGGLLFHSLGRRLKLGGLCSFGKRSHNLASNLASLLGAFATFATFARLTSLRLRVLTSLLGVLGDNLSPLASNVIHSGKCKLGVKNLELGPQWTKLRKQTLWRNHVEDVSQGLNVLVAQNASMNASARQSHKLGNATHRGDGLGVNL
jgi:hypothetical protein